jgi:hypothetical protein
MPAKKKSPKKMYTEKEYNKMKDKIRIKRIHKYELRERDNIKKNLEKEYRFRKMLVERDLKIRKYEAQLNKIKSMVFPIVPILKATDKLHYTPLSKSHLFRGLEEDEEKLNNYMEKTNLPRPDWWPAPGEM